ncbi:hypothetical protein B0H16DRAFT_1687601 [Mycena metata]|uniref:Uncharacterized protein n=1 Tax=Mycena metata TaxID=1033252 RepID=A0AAD7JIZ9_9AGAR|nr:hypothetical protein B0H16DRAFT_1687601 [Mycena metata]
MPGPCSTSGTQCEGGDANGRQRKETKNPRWRRARCCLSPSEHRSVSGSEGHLLPVHDSPPLADKDVSVCPGTDSNAALLPASTGVNGSLAAETQAHTGFDEQLILFWLYDAVWGQRLKRQYKREQVNRGNDTSSEMSWWGHSAATPFSIHAVTAVDSLRGCDRSRLPSYTISALGRALSRVSERQDPSQLRMSYTAGPHRYPPAVDSLRGCDHSRTLFYDIFTLGRAFQNAKIRRSAG